MKLGLINMYNKSKLTHTLWTISDIPANKFAWQLKTFMQFYYDWSLKSAHSKLLVYNTLEKLKYQDQFVDAAINLQPPEVWI